MKTKSIGMITTACALLGVTLTSCNKGIKAGGADTIQIRAYKAGYGTDWLHEIADKFEEAFPGKTVEFVEESPLAGDTAKQEIYNPKKNQIDLYFISDSSLLYEAINKSYSTLRNRNTYLFEDLTQVYNSKAIGFDGHEEEETIASRMFTGFSDYSKYNSNRVSNAKGKIFGLPWADGVLGIAANPSVLQKFNINYEDILTSDDLKAVVDTIYNGGNLTNKDASGNKIYPFAYAGNNAAGYWSYLYETWFAQYSGFTNFNNFIRCAPNGDETPSNIKENGYKVYQDEGILKSLEAMDKILDLNYCVQGSASNLHTDAQTDLVTGSAAFMVTGDWLLNEMKKNYFDQSKNCVMLRTPIISSLGTKIGLPNDGEVTLKALIRAIDNGDSNATIKGSLTVTDDQINAVRQARSIHDSLGNTHLMYVPSYCDAKDLAKKFIRFIYSNDGCRSFRNNAYANLPLKYTKADSDSDTEFQKSIDRIYNYDAVYMISGEGNLNDVRATSGMRLLNADSWTHPGTFKAIMNDKYDAAHEGKDRTLTPQHIFEREKTYMQTYWKSLYMVKAGY